MPIHDIIAEKQPKTPEKPNEVVLQGGYNLIELEGYTVKDWIEELAHYETSIVEDVNNYKRVDVNGYYSYSCLQFQLYTFIEYYDKWLGIKLSEDEARDIVMDCGLQKELALWMIYEDPNNYRHWLTSFKRGLGYPPNHKNYEK